MQVSIIMPYYNAAAYICETVEAIIAQTYKDWELIIVDDCSPAPETTAVLKQIEGWIVVSKSCEPRKTVVPAWRVTLVSRRRKVNI